VVKQTPDIRLRFIEGAFNRAGKNWAWPPYIVLDPGEGMVVCERTLPSPAEHAGLWLVHCRRCDFFAAATAKGLKSDLKRVTLPCKANPRAEITDEEPSLMLGRMFEAVKEAVRRGEAVRPGISAKVDIEEIARNHAHQLSEMLSLDAQAEIVVLRALTDIVAELLAKLRER
jgi:hypothetical protein